MDESNDKVVTVYLTQWDNLRVVLVHGSHLMENPFTYVELTGHFKIHVHGEVISLYIPRANEHDPSTGMNLSH